MEMLIISNYLTFLAVIFSRHYLYSTSFISTTTNGNLKDSWRFNFTIYATSFQGVILHSFDSDNNQLGIVAKHGSSGGETSITVTYNNIRKFIFTKEFCGCAKCENINITISLKFEKSTFRLGCNKIAEHSMITKDDDKVTDDKPYPLPLELVGTSGRMFIMMGNVGNYIGEGNITQTPIRDQVSGCLYSFHYNDSPLTFLGNGTAISPSCPCKGDPCKKGQCHIIDSINFTCDCSSVEFNGRYCDRNLKMYDRRGNVSFEMTNQVNELYMKLTWRGMFDKGYCLMKIVSEGENITIYTRRNQLWINNETIPEKINGNGVNFVSVNLANNDWSIKIKDKEFKKYFGLNKRVRVNIGFSGSNNICEVFKGVYDFHFNPNALHIVRGISEISVSKKSDNVSNLNTDYTSMKPKLVSYPRIIRRIIITDTSTTSLLIIGISVGLLACFLIFAITVIIMYIRSTRTLKSFLITYQIPPLASTHDLQAETGIYGKVDDSHDYDYIETMDEYTIVSD